MAFVNTLIVEGKTYTLQDINAVTRAEFLNTVGDIETALELIHDYAQGLGGADA